MPGERRFRWSLVLALLAAILSALLPLTDWGERWELRTQDARFAVRGPRPTSARIVLATLDSETQAVWQEPMAFWGGHYARLIQSANQDGARCIGLDIIPAINADEALQSMIARAADRTSPGSDAAGIETLLTAPEMNPDQQLTDAVRKAGNVVISDSRRGGTMLATEVRDQLDPQNIAFVDPPVQADEAVRTAPLEVTAASQSITGFPARLAAMAEGQNRGSGMQISHAMNGRQTVSRRGITLSYFWINYTRVNAPEPSFTRIAASRLATNELSESERRALKDAVVLVGDTVDGDEDWHYIPGGRSEEGVAIQAQAVATLLDHAALLRLLPASEAVLTLCLLGLSLPMLIRLPIWGGGLLTLGIGVFWWELGAIFFKQAQWLLPMAAPLVGLAGVFLVYHAARSAEEALARRLVESAFGHHVSPTIRDYLLATPAHLRLGGEEIEATVLFFDLRGSTLFAESHSPQAVVTELNRLYQSIVPMIEQRDGLLYRFLGDGFMAVFGAPRPFPGHARAACLAAQDIMRTLDDRNTTGSGQGLDGWSAGCGVHTGLLVYGNLGAEGRAEFTVIGDTVNLAARLEGLNKEMSSKIIVSAAAYVQAGELSGEGPFERKVAGRQEPICFYVLKSEKEGAR